MSTPLDQVLGRLGVKKPERGQYDDIIERHAATHDLDPDFVRAVIGKESSGKPGAVSPKGARGLMQLMPATAERLGVRDVHDPDQNIGGGTRYLRELLDRFDGAVPLALAGYNAGEGAVEKYGRRVPPYRETQDYVRVITSKYKGTGRAQKKEGSPTAPPAAVQTVLEDLDRTSARPAATPQTGNRPDSPGTPKPASHASPAPAAPPQATADSTPAKSSSGLTPGSRPPIETHSAGGQEASVVTAQRVRVAKARRRAAAARVELRKAESIWRQEGLQREYDMMAVRSGNFGGRNPAEVVGRVDSRLAAEEARRRYDEATAAHRRERDKLKGMKVAPARPNIASDFESPAPPPNAPPLVVTSDNAGSYRSDDILQDVDAGVSRAAAREVAARAAVVNETALREQVRRRVVFEQGGEENLARIKRDALLTEAIRAGVPGEELEKYVADRMGAPHSIDRQIEERAAAEVERLKQTDAYAKQMAATGRPTDVSDWWRDLKNRPTQLIPFIGSLPDIANILHLRDASARFERGEADEEDKIALREFRALNQAHPTVANRILSIVTQLPAFAGELALTSGSYGAVKEAAEAGIRKALTREGVSILERKAGDTLTRRALTRAGEFGVKATSATAGSAAQTPMAGSLRIVQGANERMLTRGEDAGTAFGWALVDQFIETATEHAGGVTEFIPGVSKLSKGAKRFTRPIERAGVHDIIGEMTEERLGELARAVVGLQPDFTLMGVPLKDYATAHGWAEAGKQLVAEAVGFSVPGAAHAAAAGFPAAPAEAEVAPVDGGPAEVGENVVNKSAAPASVDERVAAAETAQPPEQRAAAPGPAIIPQPTEGGGAHETVTPVPVASALDANGLDRNAGVATLGTETQTKQEGGGATATGAATGSLGFKEAFGSARNAVSDSFIDDAWARLSAGHDLLFADKPGTVEQKLQQASDNGQIGSRDDVSRIVGEYYGRATPATETTPVVEPSAPAGLQSQEKLSPVKGKPPTRAQSTGIRRRPSFDPSAHDLTRFVISEGGIRVDKDKANRGELARFFRVRPGLINNKSGRSAEDMARAAAEAGFPVLSDGGYYVPGTLNITDASADVLLDMLEDDARGLRKHYTRARDEEVDAEFERRASEEPELSAVDAAIDRALESDENFSSLMNRVLYHGSDSLSADELQELRARGIAHGLSAEVEDTLSTHSDLLAGEGEISEAGLDADEGEVDFDPTEFEDEARTDEAAATRPAEVSPEDGTAARGLERAPAEEAAAELAFARPNRAQPSMLAPAGGLFGGPQESAQSPPKHPADIQREQLAEKERERQAGELRKAFGDDAEAVTSLANSQDKLVRAVASKLLERQAEFRDKQSDINSVRLIAPLKKLADLREQGVSVGEYERQGGMFDTGLDAEQMMTLRAFSSGHAEARINQLLHPGSQMLDAPTSKPAASVENAPGGNGVPRQALPSNIEPPAADEPMMQRAFHGSHRADIKQFSIEHIGSGEGAQAYGHGLYFAGAREVGEYYRRTVSGKKAASWAWEDVSLRGEPASFEAVKRYTGDVDYKNKFVWGVLERTRETGDVGAAVEQELAYRTAAVPPGIPSPAGSSPRQVEGLRRLGARLEKDVELPQRGALYTVDLKPEEDEYLLWDKPLSEQSEKVQKALSDFAIPENDGVTGGEIYTHIAAEQEGSDPLYGGAVASRGNQKAASKYLHSLGIRGIKYLDQVSRDDGAGSYNYVIFDDADVEVEEVAFKKDKAPRGWETADSELTVNENPKGAAQAAFRPPTGGAPNGYIAANNRTISLVASLFGQQAEGAGGVFLTKKLAADAVNQLDALARSLRGGGRDTARAREDVDTVRQALSAARMASRDGAVEFVNPEGQSLAKRKQLRRHEATHRSEIDASGGRLFSEHVNEELFAAHPFYPRVRETLIEKGYADKVYTHAAEATSYIASGDWQAVGLSREEGKELLAHYFNLLTMRWGSRAAEVFRKIHPEIVEVRDEAARKAAAREEAGEHPTGTLTGRLRERVESARSLPAEPGGVRPSVRRNAPSTGAERIAAELPDPDDDPSLQRGEVVEFGPRKLPFGYTVRELPEGHELREYGDTHGVFSPRGEEIITGQSEREARAAGLEYFRLTGDPARRANQESAIRELSDLAAQGARESFRVVGGAVEDEPMFQRGAPSEHGDARRELRRASLGVTRERALPKTLEAAGLEGGADRTYEVYSNQLALEDAQELLDEKGVEGAAEYLQSVEDWGPEHTALSYLVLSKVDGARAVQVASAAARALTRQGQAIQAAQIISRLAPERVAVTASRIADAAGVRITPEQLDEFTQLAREAQDADERARELQAKAEEALKAATSADGEIEKLEAQLESQRRQLHRALEAEERNEELEKKVANLQAQLRRLKDEREAKAKPARAGSGVRRAGGFKARAGTLQHRLEQIEREARARLAARKSGDIAANFTVKGKEGERGASPIPLDIADWSIIGAAKLVRNGLDFAGWSAEVLSDLGEDVRPHLRLVYHRSLQTLQQERATLRRQRSERAGLRRAVEEGLDPDSVTADELARLIADAEDAVSERARRTQELARALAAIEPKGLGRRIFDAATDAVGAPRSLMSSGDMPPLLRQGLLLSLMHPRRAGSAFVRAIAAGMHGKTYDDIVQEINAHPRFREMRRVKLYLATIADERNEGISDVAALAAREEQFSSRLVSKLPWVKFSARNFNAFADLMRVHAYTSFAEYLESHDLTAREDRKQFEAAASFVNVTSGRGTLGRQVDQALPFLSLFGFSPRFLVARAETPFIPLSYPARAAAHSYWQLGKAGVALGAAMVLLSLVPGVSIQWWPPDDADWLKVKIGDKRWDLLGGFQQPFRFAYRVAANITARQQGKKLSRGEEPGEIVLRFLRSKTSPQASYVWDLVSGETADFDEKTGKPEKFEWLGHLFDTDGRFNPGNGILGRLAPMSPREVYKGYLKDGAAGAAAASPSMIGAGTSNYHKAERTEVPETVQGWYERLGVKAPEPGRKMKVEGRDYEMSSAEYEAYRKDVEQEAFERLQRLFEPKDDAAREKLGRYEALSEDEQKEAVHAIHRDAAEAARSRFKRALDGPGAVQLPEVVGAELSRLEISEPEGGAKITVAGKEFELTAEQRKRYTEALRAEAYKRLERLFALDGYRPLSDERKRKRVERVVELAQTQARAAMREELMPGNRRVAAEDRRAARRAGRTDESDVLRKSERREERQRRRYGLQ